MERLAPDGQPCGQCGSPLAGDQRYCLACGAGCGRRRVDPGILTARIGPAPPAGVPAPPRRLVPTSAAALVALCGGFALSGALAGEAEPVAASPAQVIVAGVPAIEPTPAPPPAPPLAPPAVAQAPAIPDVAPAPEVAPVVAPVPAVSDATPGADPPARAPAPRRRNAVQEPAVEPPAVSAALPPVRHVWVVLLGAVGFERAFGPAAESAYLSQELRARGALLSQVHGVAHGGLAGGLALLTGRAPSDAVVAGCPDAAACPRPGDEPTLLDQLDGAGRAWRAYVGDAGPTSCESGTARLLALAQGPAGCAGAVGLDALRTDLREAGTTPAFSLVRLDPCQDGRPAPCAPGAPGGVVAAEPVLRNVVDAVTASRAYADGGMLVVVAEEGEPFDVAAPSFGRTPGGGRTGALLLSPFVRPGDTVHQAYDHASLLRSVQDLLGLERTGLARDPARRSFGPRVFGAWDPASGGPADDR